MIDASKVSIPVEGATISTTPQKVVITVRMAADFKRRLDDAAHFQRLSINQFCMNAIGDAIAGALAAHREATDGKT